MRSKTRNRLTHISQRCLLRSLLIFTILYAAPSVFADNPGAGCMSMTTVNNVANNCFTVTPPVGTIAIDGVRTGVEWTGAISKDLAGDFTARVRFRRSGANLILLLSMDDPNLDPADVVTLTFDPLHNHVATADDIIFKIRRSNTGHTRQPFGGLEAAWTPGANLSVCTDACAAADFVGGWQAEVVITPADLGLPDLSAILGFTVEANNQNDPGSSTTWPSPAPGSAATFANIKTRYPIEYVLVLDQSGSMLSQSKWDLAKSAANYLANTMAMVGQPIYFDDKLGVVTFAWNVGTNLDQTTTPKPMASIGPFPLGNFVPDPPVITPVGQNFTPIGRGLNGAFNAFPLGGEEIQRIVLFMSDGLHNRPTVPNEVPLLPQHLTYRACMAPGAWSACTDSLFKVNTVALGTDAGVDTALLNQITKGFSGTCFGGGANCNATTYNLTTNAEDLKLFFIQSLDELYQLNPVMDGPSGTEFDVNANEQRLIVIASWTPPGGATAFSLQRKNNVADPWPAWPTGQVTCANTADTTVGFAFCDVASPAAGRYRVRDNMGGALGATRLFVLMDPNLRARFALDQIVHGTGQDILLTADVNEAGVPVTNDPATHPVKATVSIKRPTEGFGTYVSTHNPTNCESIKPEPPPKLDPQFGTTAGTSPINVSLTAAGILAAATGNDVKPPRFDRIDSLFSRCGKTDLTVAEDPGLDMFDDGTHGDVTPNDGIYTLRFLNTEFEGSYVFRFKVTGTSPTGSQFSRVKTVAEYVRVNVDPERTPINARDLGQSGTIVTREYWIVPRDRFGGYLGPGFPDQINFTTTNGTFITPVNDYNNGVYSQVLRFDLATGNPVVGGTVQGKPLDPVSGFASGQGFEFFPYIGGSFYDNALGLKNGFTTGARFGYRFPNQFALEFESGVTFSRFTTGPSTGQRAHLIQVLGNVRYDIVQWGSGNWTPYVIAGAGGVFLRGGVNNDSAFTFHGGFGSTWQLTNHVGIRADGRVFRFDNLNGASATTSFQVNGGVVFRF